MADDVILPLNTGSATFRTDDIGGVHHPRGKLEWGVDGTAVDTSYTNPLPVSVRLNAGAPINAAGTAALTITEISVDATTAGGNNTLLASPGPGLSIRVLNYVLNTTGAGQLEFRSGAGGAVNARIRSSGDADGAAFAGGVHSWAWTCTANTALVLVNPGGVTTVGHMLVAIV